MEKNHFIWEQCGKLAYPYKKDVPAAWNRFKVKLDAGGFKTQPYIKSFRWWPGLAAAVVTVIAMVWWMAASNPDKTITRQNLGRLDTATGPGVIVLSDGSRADLDKSALLVWPHGFNGKKREVSLIGSGFFTVARDTGRPFLIHVNDLIVKVMGTSFRLKSAAGFTQIDVRTGAVLVIRNKDSITLMPGEGSMILQNDRGKLQKTNTPQQAENILLIKDILRDMTRKGIIKENSQVSSFIVGTDSLWINDILQPKKWPWNAIRQNYTSPERPVIRYDSRYEPVSW